MDKHDFQPGYPGVLEPTTFDEDGPDGTKTLGRGFAFVPNPLPPALEREPLLGRLFDVLDRAKTRLMRLDGLVDSLPGRCALLSGMRTREAQASSQIEDTFASIQDIALAGLEENDRDDPGMEVFRNRRAIEKGLASPLPISVRLVREMHAVLIREPRHRPGQFRTIQVCIGDKAKGFAKARFVPPPGARVPELMAQWELFCNPDAPQAPARMRYPYFVELALAHYQFETIHPVSDGNGRLGRALITLAPVKDRILKHPVCNLSEWVQSHRQEYYDRLLRVSTHNEWEPWIEFFCTALAEQAAEDMRRAERLRLLYDSYTKKIASAQRSNRAIKLLDHLFDRHAVTVPLAAEIMGISYPAAQKHVERFESLGILKAVKGVSHPRGYLALGVIRAINDKDEL